jgi:hypothetical protein
MSNIKTFNSVTRGAFDDVIYNMTYTINDKMVTLYFPKIDTNTNHTDQFLYFGNIPDKIIPSTDACFFSMCYENKEGVIDESIDMKIDIYSNNPNKEFRFCTIMGGEHHFGESGTNLKIEGFCISYFIN